MKILLRQDRILKCQNESHRSVQWLKGLPFFVNPRGKLIHRVRSAQSHSWYGKFSHDSCTYWCGNTGRQSSGNHFTADPPEDRLLCERCEQLAVQHGEKTASELAGRHVHIGNMLPIRKCCKEGRN